ncbi:MAG TPA: MFS transporter, partial [Anaerolineae bacterium]
MTTSSARYALFLSCLAYLALGGFTAAMGPLVPEIARQIHASLAEVGAVFTALFFGGLIAQLVAGPASDLFGQRPILLTGLILMALGGAGIVTSRSLGSLLPLAVLAGLGHGSVDISCNLLIAGAFARRKVSALNVLHLFFGLGSVFGPAAVSLSLVLRGVGMPALAAVTIVAALLLPLAYILRVSSDASEITTDDRRTPTYRSPLLWGFAGLIALYVGIEMGVGGWTTTYVQDTLGMAI